MPSPGSNWHIKVYCGRISKIFRFVCRIDHRGNKYGSHLPPGQKHNERPGQGIFQKYWI